MKPRISQFGGCLILLAVNLIIVLALLYAFEYYLYATDPFRNLPFDTNYYRLNQQYYSDMAVPEGHYTWGHLVDRNSVGLREREIEVPKPAGVCRIVVLGDSLTWGAGLAVEERYTNLVEKYLAGTFPDKKIEVLNFGLSGGPTVVERDVLRDALAVDPASPDLIVVGYVLNDPQPLTKFFRKEKEVFDERYGPYTQMVTNAFIMVGLPHVAKLMNEALENIIVRAGIIPPWEVGLDRTYDKDSEEWQGFVQALADIKRMSDTLNLPPPYFVVLTQDIFYDRPTDYHLEDESLPIYLQWAHQAQQTADTLGYRSYNHELEILEQLTPQEIYINELDTHPSALVNNMYAKKLFQTLSRDIEAGELCGQ